MKSLKRLGASLLTLVMALAMVAPAMALPDSSENPSGSEEKDPPAVLTEVELSTPKDPAVDGVTYNVYQIFTGTPASATDKSLANIAWGASVTDNGNAIIQALKDLQRDGIGTGTNKKVLSKDYFTSTTLPTGSTALDVAKALQAADGNPADEKLIAQAIKSAMSAAAYETLTGSKDTVNSVTLPTGYYLVDNPTDIEALNLILLTENRMITVKSSKAPTMYKKVWNGTKWVDLTDVKVGDTVKFRLAATLPSGYTSMTEYGLTFHDKMQDSLSFNADSVTVKYYTPEELDSSRNPVGDGTSVTTADYSVKPTPTDGCSFEIVIDNAKIGNSAFKDLADGSVIVVEYTATLQGDNVVFGNPGNRNTAWVTDTKGNTTPKDPVGVFTFKFDITKTDANGGKKLSGAQFTLEKKNADGTWTKIDEFVLDANDADGAVFKLDSLTAGDYKLTETKAPEGYHGLSSPIEFTISYVETTDNDGNPILESITTVATNVDNQNFTSDKGTGGISSTITNYSGMQLPETGGIGTTIFYIAGGVLAVGAVVLLVTKRRVNSTDDE